MKNPKEKYNGFGINFDEKSELWYACVDKDGKDAEYDSSESRVSDSSLKKLKEKLDLMKRNKFARRSVFVRVNRYRSSSDEESEYLRQFGEATLTSIAPNGNAFYVVKGEKHADKDSLRYGSSIIIDTPENRKIIAELEKQGEIEWKAERAQAKLQKQLTKYGPEIYKEVYGKDL